MSQCNTCIHWAWTGGIVTPRVRACLALPDDSKLGRAHALLATLAADLAAAGRCPNFDAGEQFPDAYRTIDLDDLQEITP
jgi:hypothetical protein